MANAPALEAMHRAAILHATNWTRKANRARTDRTRAEYRKHADIAWNSVRQAAYRVEDAKRVKS